MSLAEKMTDLPTFLAYSVVLEEEQPSGTTNWPT